MVTAMETKFVKLFLFFFIGFIINACGCWGICRRNEGGKIVLSDGSYSSKKVIMVRYDEFEYKSKLTIKNDGSYSQLLEDPQANCKNDCNETTVAPRTRITIVDTSETKTFLDTVFYCGKDYTYSGNDIVLPTLTIP
jgi:hypothetical protein